jgi:hypothetical protein
MFAALAQSLKKIEPLAILREIMTDANIQAWIKETVTNRLLGDGVTGSLKRLRTDRSFEQSTDAYSLFTMKRKQEKGQATEHVTLFDEGDLHKSFKITLKEWGWSQEMNFANSKYKSDPFVNFTKQYSNSDEFYNDVESLTEDEMSEMISEKIYPLFLNRFDANF